MKKYKAEIKYKESFGHIDDLVKFFEPDLDGVFVERVFTMTTTTKITKKEVNKCIKRMKSEMLENGVRVYDFEIKILL